MPLLDFRLEPLDGPARTERVQIQDFVIAGWTARDMAAVQHHIDELARIGVPAPSSVPLFYRVAASQVTQDTTVQVLGADSSGEAEPVLFTHGGEMWLTIGSDHTDRKVETYSVAVSKQMCVKPVANVAWRLRDVVAHWDQMQLRSWITEGGQRVAYQSGALAAMRTPGDLIPRFCKGANALPEGTMMSCGTLGAIGGVRPALDCQLELEDPVTGRVLRHTYAMQVLPVVA
jgi:hypothetical protein